LMKQLLYPSSEQGFVQASTRRGFHDARLGPSTPSNPLCLSCRTSEK
jgi:hypothetical protein